MTSAEGSVKLAAPLSVDPPLYSGLPFVVRIGGWLFRQRSSLPLPLVAALLFIRSSESDSSLRLMAAGCTVVGLGELIRLWAVHHIGVISRTRSDRLGPLVSSGPFAFVRNPLYLGNLMIWIGFALSARLVWMAPLFLLVLGLQYHAIVRWEEQLLEARRGQEYTDYVARVPRWIPTLHASRLTRQPMAPLHSWRDTFFSERGTLIAIAAGYALLWVKSRL